MPAGSISGPDSEKIWDRAVEAASDQYKGLKSSNPDKFYAIVMTIYKSMCTKHNCEPKAEGIVPVLRRLELIESLSKAAAQKQMDDWRKRQKHQRSLDRFNNEGGYGYETEIEPPEIGDEFIYNYKTGLVYDKDDIIELRRRWNEAAMKYPGNLAKISREAGLDDGITMLWLKDAVDQFRLRTEDADDISRGFDAISKGIAETKSKIKKNKSKYLKDRHEFVAILQQYAKDISEIAKDLE